jgi:tetrahydromethanopterin S-methyltransferase subunit C
MPVAVLAVASVGTLTVAEVAYGPTGGVDLFFGTVTAGLQVAVAFLTLPIAYLAGLIPSKERSRVLLFAATIASLAFVIAGVIELNVLEAAFAAMAITVAIYATLFARANAMLQAWQDECARDIPADRLTMSATPEPSRPIIPDSA